jgi:hypothetical protein
VPGDNRKDLVALRAYYEGVAGALGPPASSSARGYFSRLRLVVPIGQGRANVGVGVGMDVSNHDGINAPAHHTKEA